MRKPTRVFGSRIFRAAATSASAPKALMGGSSRTWSRRAVRRFYPLQPWDSTRILSIRPITTCRLRLFVRADALKARIPVCPEQRRSSHHPVAAEQFADSVSPFADLFRRLKNSIGLRFLHHQRQVSIPPDSGGTIHGILTTKPVRFQLCHRQQHQANPSITIS